MNAKISDKVKFQLQENVAGTLARYGFKNKEWHEILASSPDLVETLLPLTRGIKWRIDAYNCTPRPCQKKMPKSAVQP